MPVALITGAAQGLGRRTAEILAGGGYELVLADVQDLEAVRSALAASGRGVCAIRGDLSTESHVEQIAGRIEQQYGALDVLVNNAGISCIERAEETSSAQWRRVLEVNLFAPFLLCKYLGRQMLARRAGSIVNVASIAGLAAIGHRAAYNASKHGLVGLTRTLAAEWGGRGVRVNAVCPGWIKTEMDAADQFSGAYADADITARVPMGRFASPDDVAQAIAFLADPQRSAFLNGVALPVDGGWLADASWEKLRLSSR